MGTFSFMYYKYIKPTEKIGGHSSIRKSAIASPPTKSLKIRREIAFSKCIKIVIITSVKYRIPNRENCGNHFIFCCSCTCTVYIYNDTTSSVNNKFDHLQNQHLYKKYTIIFFLQ